LSRSRKKIPGYKQKNIKYYKKLVHNRNKNRPMQNGSYYKYSVNPWSICDWTYLLYTDIQLQDYIDRTKELWYGYREFKPWKLWIK
jgi:hypothetical protein